jgi:hypothetical protein
MEYWSDGVWNSHLHHSITPLLLAIPYRLNLFLVKTEFRHPVRRKHLYSVAASSQAAIVRTTSMFNLLGQRRQFCDRLPRRDFLRLGALSLGGLSLPQLLAADARAGLGRSHKAVIMVYLSGGPPHQDMFDLKPEAPREIRGEFSPIATNVPGIEICEHLPRIASMMDKFVAIRSLVGAQEKHASFQCLTGHTEASQPQGGWPAIGAVISKLLGPADRAVPPAVDVSQQMAHKPYNLPGPGFLGLPHAPFRPSGETLADMVLLESISMDRLADRRTLLSQFDSLRRRVDALAPDAGLDAFTEQALGVLTSNRLVAALDLEREDPRVRARYGQDQPDAVAPRFGSKGYGALTSRLLLARRVVEAGARLVTCSFADFDWHGKNFETGKRVLPLLDQGVSALVTDLYERGLDRDVTVIVWGEFGRTPKINERAGRDHWPNVACALLAGGGMRTGQVIGATDRLAAEAVERPVHFQEVFATLYHNLGIDVALTTLTDFNGRPHYLADAHPPIHELVAPRQRVG